MQASNIIAKMLRHTGHTASLYAAQLFQPGDMLRDEGEGGCQQPLHAPVGELASEDLLQVGTSG